MSEVAGHRGSPELAPEGGFLSAGDRAGAFAAAARHTARVKFLRRVILVASVAGILGLLCIAIFDPFGPVATDQPTTDHKNQTPDKITMELPELKGVRKDGRPYNVTMKSAVQDTHKPNVFELNVVDAKLGMANGSTAHVTAPTGEYDQPHDIMRLYQDVHVISDDYQVTMKSATVQLKANEVSSDEPVQVIMRSGTINADRMHTMDGGKAITFEGNVHSVFTSASDTADAKQNLNGTVQ
ncbi:LPS export ABC transporter periplasmic protein LptC [Methylovirgula sp. 4M-Z18]|uniref:LPS export ABC transporter periplasmic protein LptC n=1 Tax=Methylovirgula sp. 4M-Z18 TaxID=2293567 RepID=UPI000E2EFC12|nr:LPS export ABC transporter periplasmic protein LptC [Methylovirgula sp. 4M-Z18]RFB79566.1 LPS export ABC transporter periplasmic protein LptC [Methylovirgula sp. 4M-Z18]